MEIYVYWFLLAFTLFGLEMMTGTFYLLVIGIAMAVGGVVALLGGGIAVQLTLGAITGVTGTILLRRWKSNQAGSAPSVDLDVGQAVKVLKWNDDGSARVFYRGAEWDAALERADTPREGTLYIAAVRGSALVLTHLKP